MVPDITWGRHTRVVMDVGCGVASFGAYLLQRNILTVSVAPKDVHENQIQFALERGWPAMVAAFATRRLLYPSQAFDLIHCSRCRINWTHDDGIFLLELDRMLRAGGYFAWAAQPVYKLELAQVEHWKAYYLPQNAGDIARKYIKDPQLLSFIDAECFIVNTVNALLTPMINASMVLCDRHFGGINYPIGGVGGIAKSLAKGLVDQGSEILYKANVGLRLSNGRELFAKTIISNATTWDTFGKLLKGEELPKEENFQKVYVKAPSFLSIHMGVKAEVLPPDTDCHHFVLADSWTSLEKPYGSIFLSIPTVLDSSLAPEGRHILHIFTTSSIEDWEVSSKPKEL